MKNNLLDFTADGEATAIACELKNVQLRLTPTAENQFKITYEDCKDARVCFNEGVLSINYGSRKRLFSRKKKSLEIYVPEHAVPSVSLTCSDCDVRFAGALLDKLNLYGEDCRVVCEDASFSQCSVTGTQLSSAFKSVTVKGALVVKCAKGDMLWENCFAAHAECRVKKGNIGLSGFNCKESAFEAENGNITARLSGDESEYSLGLLIKEGTANRQSVLREGAARSFKAYSLKGNVTIDFTPDENAGFYGEK